MGDNRVNVFGKDKNLPSPQPSTGERGGMLLVVVLLLVGCVGEQRGVIEAEVDGVANPWTNLAVNNDPDNFQFAIVSDRTGGHREGVFEDAIDKLNLLQPEFVVSVGDQIEGYIEDEEELHHQWEEFSGFVEKLDMPYFYVPGNHDMQNPVQAGVWAARFGRSYYHFVYLRIWAEPEFFTGNTGNDFYIYFEFFSGDNTGLP